MNIKNIKWCYHNNQTGEQRYCSHCKAVVAFSDSGKRRQNANGKTIHHYQIYKCPNDHTWNKKIDQFKAFKGIQNYESEVALEIQNELCDLSNILTEPETIWQIAVHLVGKPIRIDKLLANMFAQYSRNKLCDCLAAGTITLNRTIVSKKTKVRDGDLITINLLKRV